MGVERRHETAALLPVTDNVPVDFLGCGSGHPATVDVVYCVF